MAKFTFAKFLRMSQIYSVYVLLYPGDWAAQEWIWPHLGRVHVHLEDPLLLLGLYGRGS